MSVNTIFKVNNLIDENIINKIYVFYGFNLKINDTKTIQKKFKKNPKDEIFLDKTINQYIFNDYELKNIKDNNIEVIFLNEIIHIDDNIGSIKLKIANALPNVSLEEMYLFCTKSEKINSINIYQTLSQNNKLTITNLRLQQFLKNIVKDTNNNIIKFNIPHKEKYEYDDILNLNINGKIFMINKVLGQKFFIVSNEYQFIVNPFQVTEYDNFI